jgi:hypothetical protein
VKLAAATLASLIFAMPASSHGRQSPHELQKAFICIHHYEGAWNANTGNGYYGGLQMDIGFQRSYGSEFLSAFGTADRWPPSLQLAVAIKAYLSGRGFGPWPNTARMCGLR